MIAERFLWFPSLKRSLKARGNAISHTLFDGATTTGKTYKAFWDAEFGVMEGDIKFCHLWIQDIDRLEEALSLALPADMKRYSNPNIWDKYTPKDWVNETEIHLYIPITAHIKNVPAELRTILKPFQFPNNDRVKVFFYDLPCDRLGERAVQILFGARDSAISFQEYIGVVKNAMQFAELKWRLSKTRFTNIDTNAKGFGNTISAVKFHGSSAYPAISSLLNRLNAFTDEGILNTSSSKYSLPKLFRENHEFQNQKAIVLLYSGFIKQEYLRVFNLVSFIEFQWQAMSSIKHKIDFKVVDYINEAGVLFPKQKDKFYKGVHQALTSFARWLIPQSRHAYIELWMDTQNYDYLDEGIRSQFIKNYVTRYTDDSGIERFASILSIDKSALRRVWNEWGEKKIYRFFDTSLPINTWEDENGKLQLGFELPRPRLSYDGKVSLTTFPLQDFQNVWLAYQKMMRDGEAKTIETIKRERERAKMLKKLEAQPTGISMCKAIMDEDGVDPAVVKTMDKQAKDGLIQKIQDRVKEKFNETVTLATVKRALGIWKG